MKFRNSRISEPNNKSVRINKNENEKIMVKSDFHSAKKETMDFSIAKSDSDRES